MTRAMSAEQRDAIDSNLPFQRRPVYAGIQS
jgi:hypothetical protein